MTTTSTVAQRIFQVRLACGDGMRKPEPMRAFAERVSAVAPAPLYASRLSDLENGKAKPTLEEAAAISAVDPEGRGLEWLAGTTRVPILPLMPAEEWLAEAQAAEAAKKKAASKGGRRRG